MSKQYNPNPSPNPDANPNRNRYPPELTARAMGYNNVIVAVAGAVGPYVLTCVVTVFAVEKTPSMQYLNASGALELG